MYSYSLHVRREQKRSTHSHLTGHPVFRFQLIEAFGGAPPDAQLGDLEKTVVVCRDEQGFAMVTRGFTGRGSIGDQSKRIPPGQHLVDNFPVLSAGPTPSVELSDWKFTVKIGPKPTKVWNWTEFNALPKTKVTRDIHCVTSWSKLDTVWEGVLIDDILADAGLDRPTEFVLAHSYDNYSTNVPLADLLSGKAMVALNYDGKPLARDHGGPARLLVPHLYFWKSAKWVNGLQFTRRDEPGFWEGHGYHIYGDPWREQRYTND